MIRRIVFISPPFAIVTVAPAPAAANDLGGMRNFLIFRGAKGRG
jgi:hypothetical protein